MGKYTSDSSSSSSSSSKDPMHMPAILRAYALEIIIGMRLWSSQFQAIAQSPRGDNHVSIRLWKTF